MWQTTILALALAALMGVAIQSGGTCTVAAVDEVLHARRADRLLAMVVAALWVAGVLGIARAAGLPMAAPTGYPLGLFAVLGGALLGVGAYVNGACAFGTVARIGAGQWAWLATPAGFAAGIVLADRLAMHMAPSPLPARDAGLGSALASALVLLALAVAWWQHRRRRGWSPADATLLIGLCFVGLMLSVGDWSWSDSLARVARRMGVSDAALRLALVLALFGGSVLASLRAGTFASSRVAPAALARRFAGGAIMAFGAALVPGSNDTLLLVGLPMFWAYAWVAFASMVVAIVAAMALADRWSAGPTAPSS